MSQSIHTIKQCPTCNAKVWNWLVWCSKCDSIVCSNCLNKQLVCSCGQEYILPGRGKRFFETMAEVHTHT